ncbi:YqgQ family protein [Pallidibacillus pasinlerensis]|uniref:YqgQ family protein n=1 Tax=Pallidibacillus pasinlerensis TaxID=2703818 RepID=A0ABX0A5U6_9BACI|nr:YqgQ family protein [Pallidibacillus pasinlerensis]NCU17886.1 YqgQ family protein [Pallidibacillus pasinlerensis]
MNSIYDVRQLLKRFGSFIYVGDRLGDLQLMEDELKQLYYSNVIDQKEFQMALLLVRHEIQLEKEKKKNTLKR